MTVRCLACAQLEDLRKTPQHAAVGWGRCPGDPPGAFVNIGMERGCRKFAPAPKAVASKRIIWLESLK